MSKKSKIILLLVCAGLFASLGCTALAVYKRTYVKTAVKRICKDTFLYHPAKKVYTCVRSCYWKIKPPVSEMQKIPLPGNWSVDWKKFPSDGKIQQKKDGILIQSKKNKVVIRDSKTDIFGKKAILEVRASNPGNRKAVISFNVHGKDIIPVETHELAKGESKYISFDFPQVQSLGITVPQIMIQGTILLQELKLEVTVDPAVTVAEGEIIERSALPDPANSDYPDCRFTVHFKGNSILSGPACKEELSLVLEGFRNYKALHFSEIKTGDKVRCALIPFDNLPEEQKSTQQADDLNLFTLDSYYVKSVSVVKQFKDEKMFPASGISFSDANENYVSIFERKINPPVLPELVEAQKKQIAADLAKMNQLLDGWEAKREELNKKFNEVWDAEKAKDKPGYNRVKMKKTEYVWRNINNSFWALPVQYQLIGEIKQMPDAHLQALIALKKALETNGIQLIVSLVPDFYAISSRVINPEFRDIPDYQTAVLVKQLAEAGIESVYASDAIIKDYNRFPWAFYYPHNSHPSDTCQEVLADILAERLTRYQFPKTLNEKDFTAVQRYHVYTEKAEDYFLPEHCDIGDNTPGTPYKNRCILYQDKNPESEHSSPVLIIGNSFIQTPMGTPKGEPDSLYTMLSQRLQIPIESYRISSNGPMVAIMQNFFSKPEYHFENKKILIVQLGVDHTTRAVTWNNLLEMDRIMLLKKNKTLIDTIVVTSGKEPDKTNAKRKNAVWKSLPDKHEFICETEEQKELIAKITLPELDPEKKIYGLITATAYFNDHAALIINDKHYDLPEYVYNNIRWQAICFELLAGTKNVEIYAKGKKGSLFAIRNMEIYQ